jgi:hypothetical protein
MLFIILEIPYIPLTEARKAIEDIKKKYKIIIIKEFIWQNGLAIFFKKKEILIKGPKLLDSHIVMFKKKMIQQFITGEFFEDQTHFCFKTVQDLNLMDMIYNVSWIKPIKIFSHMCCRPITKIFLPYINENYSYCGIFPIIKEFTPESLKEYYKSQNILIDQEDKKKLLPDYIDHEGIFNSANPCKVFIPLQDKYNHLPIFLIEFIIPLENKVIPVFQAQKLIGFDFILNKFIPDTSQISLSLYSRLEDLSISYARDIKRIIFTDQNNINEDFQQSTNNLIQDFNILIDKEKLIFLINNYKNDFCTSLVEEYPSTMGIITSTVYKDTLHYDPVLEEAFLCFFQPSLCINNIYALILFLSDKIYFLSIIARDNQLFTATQDPFATKDIIDLIISLLIMRKYNLPIMSKHLLQAFHKRIIKFYQHEDYSKNIRYENIPLNQVNIYLKYLQHNYDKLKTLLQRVNFFIRKTPIYPQILSLKLPDELDQLIPFIENILNTINITNHPEYIILFKEFDIKMNYIFQFA